MYLSYNNKKISYNNKDIKKIVVYENINEVEETVDCTGRNFCHSVFSDIAR